MLFIYVYDLNVTFLDPFWLKSARPTDVSDFPTQRTVKEEDTTNITTDVMNHYT